MSPSETSASSSGELKRRWATIIAADIVGYTRLMSADPAQTVTDLDVVRGIVEAQVRHYGGHVTDLAGDAIIAVFDTAVGAIYAAQAVQAETSVRADGQAEERQMRLRIGIHMGEILQKSDGTVYGDGVNLAARIESVAPVGGIAVSQEVVTACSGADSFEFVDQGAFDAKNAANPVHVHLVKQVNADNVVIEAEKMSRRPAKGNLPVRVNALIGRENTLADVISLLADARLVTLFGMGGLGKTSLSIETAQAVGHTYSDGAWFIDLAAVSTADALGMAVAGVFGVPQESGKTIEESVIAALRSRHMLLIFDNCEHVTEAAAQLADALLTGCPKISIIATSRELLSISGEQVVAVEPLDTSGADAPAIELFTQRARAVSPSFDSSVHKAAIQNICTELDGIPLAIELAAARAKSMTPTQIYERLGQRFRLLKGGSRAVRERHQTLHNAVQWSYDLLTDTEATVLDRASVFAGGFTLDAAEAVCAGGDVDEFDVIDTLDSLVSKSLVIVNRSDEAIRYRILQTIRTFGADRLAQTEDEGTVRQAHAMFYAGQADTNFELWRSADQLLAHEWLDLEINNLRDAFHWALDNDVVDPAARIASSVGDLGRFALREEAASWAEEVVGKARDAQHPRLIILLTWSASSAWAFGRFDDAQSFGDEALSLLEDDRYVPFVWAYGDLAFVSIFSGNVDKAIELLAQGAAHPADAHDRFMMAFHLFIMATAGHADAAREIADDVVKQVDAAGVPMSIAVAHAARGAALEADDPETALAEYEFGIDVASKSGARFMETLIAPRIAALHGNSGDAGEGLQGFERMLLAYGDATDMGSISAWRTNLVILLAKTGQFQAAATLHGTLVGVVDQSSLAPEHESAIKRTREALGLKTFSRATEAGSGMSPGDATDYAIAQVQLGLASMSAPVAAAV